MVKLHKILMAAGAGLLAISTPVAAEDMTGLTDTTIKVGVMGPFTGKASS